MALNPSLACARSSTTGLSACLPARTLSRPALALLCMRWPLLTTCPHTHSPRTPALARTLALAPFHVHPLLYTCTPTHLPTRSPTPPALMLFPLARASRFLAYTSTCPVHSPSPPPLVHSLTPRTHVATGLAHYAPAYSLAAHSCTPSLAPSLSFSPSPVPLSTPLLTHLHPPRSSICVHAMVRPPLFDLHSPSHACLPTTPLVCPTPHLCIHPCGWRTWLGMGD
ncbi:hypothetical protein CTheo_9001 [Ceratobasidium theobromae]|uniref:Uncharacterized protein n=1 Tax=Ceratobasidium theobromae TaxID=1582974 RepID=A0A5N5Q6V3_9AGAM|nr:hypothetical protein CTheo_9001 [Ceratobasidium theobromae]